MAIFQKHCMVNLLQVIYLWLYSVRALYGKFIAGNLFVSIFSRGIVW